MKLAFSTNAYKKTTLESAVASIGSLGYAGVEIMADIPHAYPPDMPADRTARLRDLLARLNLQVSNVNAFTLFALGDTYHPSWIDDDAAKIEQRITHTLNSIRLTAALGGTTISLEPGGPLGTSSRHVALDRYEAGLRRCLPLAQQLGITLLVEPEPGLLIEHAADCIAFLERINHPHLRMNCDLGHFYCVNEDPAEVVRKYAPWIAHVHAEDIAATRVHQHLIPGLGAMDWPAIFAALRATPYAGWITVELYPYETTAEQAARQALGYLQRFLTETSMDKLD